MSTSHTPSTEVSAEVAVLQQRVADLQSELEFCQGKEQESRAREQQLATHNLVLVNLSRSTAIEQGNVVVACNEITHAAAHTLGVERVSVWMFTADRTSITCLDLYRSSVDEHSSGLRLNALDYPNYFQALEEDRTIAASDAKVDPRTCEFDSGYLTPLGITSMLDAPVRIGGKCIGLICHEHIGPRRTWTLEDQAFAGSMADFVAMTLQAEQRRQCMEEIRESEQRLRQVIDLVPHMIFAKDRRGRFLLANRTVAEAFGTTVENIIGKSHRALHDSGEEASRMLADDLEVIENNQLKFIPSQQFTDCHGHHRILQTTKMPLKMGVTREPAVLGVAIDITEAKRCEEKQSQLIAELDHRVKNNLTAVLSLAEQTALGASTIEKFVPAFTGRIRAMSVAHEMLARTKWQGADLAELLPRLTEPFRRGRDHRIVLEGPSVMLPATVAPSLAMTLHELVTNAARHGSLVGDSGSVQVTWNIEPDGAGGHALNLQWVERGGPVVSVSPRRGFGLRLIERSATYQLHGRSRLLFDPSGFRAEFVIPLGPMYESTPAIAANGHALLAANGANGSSIHEFPGLRVLVVEDDFLVSESLQRLLMDMGCQIVGPASTAADACQLVKDERVDAAILDVNLSPGTSEPVARALQYKRCPFFFLTGYSMAGLLPDDLRGYRVLAKPVDPVTLRSAMHELSRAR